MESIKIKLKNGEEKTLEIKKYIHLNDGLIYKILKDPCDNKIYLKTRMTSSKIYDIEEWNTLIDLYNDIKDDLIDIYDNVGKTAFNVNVSAYFTSIVDLPPYIKTKEDVLKYLNENLKNIKMTELEYINDSDELDVDSIEIY